MHVMKIALLEPYYAGSHASWVDALSRVSRHQITPFTLPGSFWKWRMHGGAVTLARRFLEAGLQPDLLLATDMLDLTTFLALTRRRTAHTPAALYMHENQLTYPLRPGEKRDLHYGFINYASMLAADLVLFNSAYHMESIFQDLPRLLKHFPDYNELGSLARLRERSQVLPLGIDLARYDQYRPAAPRSGPPLILWNHRWEYDKNPGEFFRVLFQLADEGLEFQVALAGENNRQSPVEFEAARARLGGRIVHYGFADDFETYARLLWRADILPVTSRHDFFGVSVVEAIYCGAWPLLPARLTYPDFIPAGWKAECLYRTGRELVARLRRLILEVERYRASSFGECVAQYDWTRQAGAYDACFQDIVDGQPCRRAGREAFINDQ
jgi:glycosyltransferase involved in cell wall biosynthesis